MMFVLIAGVIVNIPTITYVDPRDYKQDTQAPGRTVDVCFAGGSVLHFKGEDADEAYRKLVASSERTIQQATLLDFGNGGGRG